MRLHPLFLAASALAAAVRVDLMEGGKTEVTYQRPAFGSVRLPGKYLAGGGLRTGKVVRAADELGGKVEERPVSLPDFPATIQAALDIDPAQSLFAGDRPVPITDRGRPMAEFFG